MTDTAEVRHRLDNLRDALQRTQSTAADEIGKQWRIFGEIRRVQRRLSAGRVPRA